MSPASSTATPPARLARELIKDALPGPATRFATRQFENCARMGGRAPPEPDTADALPAVQAYFEGWPHGEAPSEAELRELVEVAARFVTVSNELLRYVKALDGRPSKN